MAETSGRNAVLTGAAGGMGRAITEALLESGRRVVLVDRAPESLRQFAA
jgi:3-hydroxy acid dehydrogenase/malonic semialdehyde reductase